MHAVERSGVLSLITPIPLGRITCLGPVSTFVMSEASPRRQSITCSLFSLEYTRIRKMHSTLPGQSGRKSLQSQRRADFKRSVLLPVRFMRSGDQEVGRGGSDDAKLRNPEPFDLISSKSLDEALLSSMSTMSQQARDSLGKRCSKLISQLWRCWVPCL